MMPKLKYGPGSLLKEYSYNARIKKYEWHGLFLIVRMDEFDAHTIALYDSDDCYKPLSKISISHEDLHRKGKMFKWEIL